MEYFIPVIIFLFGTVIGSFLNMVIWRHNTGRSFGGRSHCDVCSRDLRWHELVPIFSWLSQGGKCRMCKTKLSFIYPVFELFTGLVFLFIVSRFVFYLPHDFGHFMYFVLYYALVFSIMIVIAGYDLRHKIVPNNLVYPLIVIAFLGLFFSGYGWFYFHPATLTSILAGPIVALPLFILWAVSKGEWLGFGDVKLAIAIGLLLGTSRGFAALVLSFWIGALIAIVILLVNHNRKSTRKMEVPFAPFMVLGTAVAFFFDIGLLELLRAFQ